MNRLIIQNKESPYRENNNREQSFIAIVPHINKNHNLKRKYKLQYETKLQKANQRNNGHIPANKTKMQRIQSKVLVTYRVTNTDLEVYERFRGKTPV